MGRRPSAAHQPIPGLHERLRRGWMPESADDIDLAIIDLLQADGRASYRSIADELGLSEATVRKRAARLLDEELIQVVAIPNVLASRSTVMAMLQVRVSGDPDALARLLGGWPEVTWVALVAGQVDLMVEIMCANRDAVLGLLRRLHALDQVQEIDSSLYLKVYKQLYIGPLLASAD